MTPRDSLLRLALLVIAIWALGCVIFLVFAGGRMGEAPKPQPMRVGALCSPPTPAFPAASGGRESPGPSGPQGQTAAAPSAQAARSAVAEQNGACPRSGDKE
jgi:hypothetical protein